ncbi:uncharacterized protein LOC111519089 [Drosophila willistoni]|uniref:uncharacterized protein LOC111519089 n=1 Tax=Drosophila willistoni TaxID=7260 RepID=UPI001F07A524|nr:uncharacterized protein LOC111519089 [Drosophila willistoni]
MERKHKRCSFKRSGSICMIREIPHAMCHSKNNNYNNNSSNSSSPQTSPRSSISSNNKTQHHGKDTSNNSLNINHQNVTKKSTQKSFKLFSFLFKNKKQNGHTRTRENEDGLDPKIDTMKEEDVRKLIQMYHNYENLYNPRNICFGNKKIDEDCYIQMIQSFPGLACTSDELRIYLEELKKVFQEEYTIIENARRNYGQVVKPSIQHYNELLFLVPHLSMHFDNNCPKGFFNRSKSTLSLISRKSAGKLPSLTQLQHSGASSDSNKSAKCPKNELNPIDFVCIERNKQRKLCFQGDQAKINDNAQKKQLMQQEQVGFIDPRMDSTSWRSKMAPPNSSSLPSSTRDCHLECPLHAMNQSNSKPYHPNYSSYPQISKVSVESSFYSDEKSMHTIDLTCPSRMHVLQTDSVQRPIRPTPPARTKPHRIQNIANPEPPASISSAPTTTTDQTRDNGQQVQMLCEMIRTELTNAPDFIYFDAKWRIIEILREVHKRQLVHIKASTPHQLGKKSQTDSNDVSKPMKSLPQHYEDMDHHSGYTRVCSKSESHCPYCHRHSN